MCDTQEYKLYAGLHPRDRKMRERLDLNFAVLFLLKLPTEGSIVHMREIILFWVLGSSKSATQHIYFIQIKIKIIKKRKAAASSSGLSPITRSIFHFHYWRVFIY